MAILFQINECLHFSTGKIAQQIGESAIAKGWNSWVAYSGREPAMRCKSQTITIGNYPNAFIHYINQKLFDNEGLNSKYYTKKLISKIKAIGPDIIQLHNIHDHWLSYPVLFEYLASIKTPVVWTQHDCWSFTGGCMYFDLLGCDLWKNGCKSCPDNRAVILNQAGRNFLLKKEYISKIPNLTFVCVSDWLSDLMRNSIQKERPIITIHNGVDLSLFRVQKKKKETKKFRILGAAAVWDARKGLSDFLKLREVLPTDFEITLVGLSENQKSRLPEGIHGITRTTNVEEMIGLYNESDVFVNPTYSDNFPTTNIEALACGTPVITYRTGGSPEAIDENTGYVVEQGDFQALVNRIYSIRLNPLSTEACRTRAMSLFDKNKCYEKYLDLYNQLLGF